MLNQQYKQILRVRNALLIYFIVCAVIVLSIISLIFAGPHHGPDIQMHGHSLIIPVMIIFLAAAFPAAIFATVIGSGLASENASTLPWAWTKPVSRTTYALGMFAVDSAAIIAAYVIAVLVLGLLPLAAFGLLKYLTFGPADAGAFLRGLVFPLAVYGALQAFTASLRRNAGLVIGLSWPILGTLAGLREVDLAQPFRGILAAINLINPWAYISFHFSNSDFASAAPLLVQQMVQHGLALALIAAVAVVAATLQWNRLEA